ncbi:MAG TPA: cache domain-containing protein [Nostocaceae cyanobacterium]|nr:cache domain-containing protein [Nostocaceae cyanobacterium]
MLLNTWEKISSIFKTTQYQLRRKLRSPNLTTSLILIAATVGTSVISIGSYKILRILILQQLQEKALLRVETKAQNIDQWLANRSYQVQTIASTDIVRSMNWLTIQPYLRAEAKRIDEFHGFSLTDTNANLYTSTNGKVNFSNVDRKHIQEAFQGEVSISDPFLARTNETPLIGIAAPIFQDYEMSKPPIGVLSGTLRVDVVHRVVNTLDYGKDSYAFALNSQGEPIIHPNPTLMSTIDKPAPSFLKSNDASLAAIARRMVDRKQGIELIPIDGTNKYVAYVPLKQVNWSLALVVPRDNIESQLWPLNLLASIVGILLIISFMAAWQQVNLSAQAKEQVVLLSQQQKQLKQQATELEQALQELKLTQTQLIQTEKMSSLGRLVAGIAHEINNPVSFIYSNVAPAEEYIQDLLELLQIYQDLYPQPSPEIQNKIESIELDFVKEDLPKLLTSMAVGANRIKEIVLALRNFSRLDEADIKIVDIHEGIDNTLMIFGDRFQATEERSPIEVTKKYGKLPLVECYPGKLNQAFMNIIMNAIDAVEESQNEHPQICIRTEITDDEQVRISIADNGIGIPEEKQSQLFDPFFTTKVIGKGTGLGLFTTYQIVTEIHQGKLECISTPSKGSEFIITIPLHQNTPAVV